MEKTDKIYLRLEKIIEIEKIIIRIVIALLVIWSINVVLNRYYDIILYFKDDILIFYGIFILFLIVLFFSFNIYRVLLAIKEKKYCKNTIIHWISYFGMITIMIYFVNGYRIAVKGMYALINNLDFTSSQAHYILIKLYPENIITPLYSLLIKLFGKESDYLAYNEFFLSFNSLLIIYVILFIIALFFNFNFKLSKIVKKTQYTIYIGVFIFIAYMISLKFYFKLAQNELSQVIYIGQLLIPVILFFEVIILFGYYKNKVSIFTALPFNAKSTIFIILFFMPLLASFQNSFSHELKIQKLIKKAKEHKTMIVTAKLLNIRKGPSSTYEIVGKLKKGQKIIVQQIKNSWVMVEKDHWVSIKYLKEL